MSLKQLHDVFSQRVLNIFHIRSFCCEFLMTQLSRSLYTDEDLKFHYTTIVFTVSSQPYAPVVNVHGATHIVCISRMVNITIVFCASELWLGSTMYCYWAISFNIHAKNILYIASCLRWKFRGCQTELWFTEKHLRLHGFKWSGFVSHRSTIATSLEKFCSYQSIHDNRATFPPQTVCNIKFQLVQVLLSSSLHHQ